MPNVGVSISTTYTHPDSLLIISYHSPLLILANGMTKWVVLAIAALAFFGFFLIKFSSDVNIVPTNTTRYVIFRFFQARKFFRSLHHVHPRANYITPNSIFVYNAYLDKRGGSNKLRVLAINRCHKESEL